MFFNIPCDWDSTCGLNQKPIYDLCIINNGNTEIKSYDVDISLQEDTGNYTQTPFTKMD